MWQHRREHDPVEPGGCQTGRGRGERGGGGRYTARHGFADRAAPGRCVWSDVPEQMVVQKENARERGMAILAMRAGARLGVVGCGWQGGRAGVRAHRARVDEDHRAVEEVEQPRITSFLLWERRWKPSKMATLAMRGRLATALWPPLSGATAPIPSPRLRPKVLGAELRPAAASTSAASLRERASHNFQQLCALESRV